MKTAMAALTGTVLVIAVLIWTFDRSSSPEVPVPQGISTESSLVPVASAAETPESPAQVDAVPGATVVTKEQFDAMPPEGQDKAVEAFIASFWKSELAGPVDDGAAQEPYLSLELFERPYMRSITEEEFQRLSPEEQQKAISEITESCLETRAKILDRVSQAQATIAGGNHAMGEACLISALETGRELTASSHGMLITRLTGIACQKAALKGLVDLHSATGDDSRAQVMRGHLQDLDAQAGEIRNAAQAAGR